ncbi:MAG: 16S rRNA (uracil(1498)-N(3))-methyltransferase [Rikenellaceae bacterium]
MQLFYAPNFTSPLYTLPEDESKHCVRVLRLEVGATLHITDGRGTMFRCVVEDAHPKRCTVRVVEQTDNYDKLPYNLTIAVAPTKNTDRYEWFLEKATEVGVATITPIISAHSERKTLKHERELRVITSAMKQSLKAYHPTLDPLTTFADFIKKFSGDSAQKFIAHCNEPQAKNGVKANLSTLVKKGGEIVVMIGPEGDFSPEEVKAALAAGFTEVALGTQRLRTETAALMAVSMVAINNME